MEGRAGVLAGAVAAARKAQRLHSYPIAAHQAALRGYKISSETWRKIEETGHGRPSSFEAIDAALDWPAGTCMEILDGAEPPALPGKNVAGILQAVFLERSEDLARKSSDELLAEATQLSAAANARLEQLARRARSDNPGAR